MYYRIALLWLSCLGFAFRAAAQEDYTTRVNAYISQYKQLAILEQHRSGIPAAIKLAQGIHETGAGSSRLATLANNHFGIKCKREWTGETLAHTDDAPDECFRKYSSATDSYKDHSDYLRDNTRYNTLFKLSPTDYAAWAYGLKKCGYATNPRYAQRLIKIIEDYKLQEYTYAALSGNGLPFEEIALEEDLAGEIVPEKDQPVPAPEALTGSKQMPSPPKASAESDLILKNTAKPEYEQLVKVNGLRAFYAQKGTTLLHAAAKYRIRYAKLLELNDLPDAPLEADMFIYLDKKHTKGKTSLHVVKPGETLLQAAQYEGMQVKMLRHYNRIGENEEPAPGALLYLQESAPKKPETIAAAPIDKNSIHFSGSDPGAIPPGSSRTRSGYLTKQEIENNTHNPAIALPPVPHPAASTAATTGKIVGEKTGKDLEYPANVETEVPAVLTASTGHAQPVHTAIENKRSPLLQEEKKESVMIQVNTSRIAAERAEASAPEKPAEAPEGNTAASPVPARTAPPPVALPDPERLPSRNTRELAVSSQTTLSQPVIQKVPEPIIPSPTEPKDEYDRLKMKLDKVVYAARHQAPAQPEKEVSLLQEKPQQAAATPGSRNVPATQELYTVKKGDTAFGIAKRHNITMRQLMEWNNLNFEELKVGQRLRIK